MKFSRNKLYVIAGVAAASFVVYFYVPPAYRYASDLVKSSLESQGSQSDLAETIRQEVFSAPLRGRQEGQAAMTRGGIIAETNRERQATNVALLSENRLLDAAAAKKLDDIFDRQYFEHVSPDGRGPGYLAEQAGYNYVVVGENLALGNFKNDSELLAAWMASSGHRANILNDRFTEIGVAVGHGMFQGKNVWIAVQEFGKPASDCPSIDSGLKVSIETHKQELDQMSIDLATKKSELATAPKNTPAELDAYNKKIDEYNSLAGTYNTKIQNLKIEISKYNFQVQAFNACIK